MTHVFVAPHPDDVALSCGGLIASLRELGQNVTIITVFSGQDVNGDVDSDGMPAYEREALGFGSKTMWPSTEAFNRSSILPDYPLVPAWVAEEDRLESTQSDADAAAKRFWQRSSWYRRASIRAESLAGQAVIDELPTQGAVVTEEILDAAAAGDQIARRRIEDERYAYFAEASIVFLDQPDAIFRGYETEEQLLGQPRDDDMRLDGMLRREIDRLEPQQVYLPLGVGGHVDHQLCRQAGIDLLRLGDRWVMPGPEYAGTVVFYEDFPYSLWGDFKTLDQLGSDAFDDLPAGVSLFPAFADIADQIEKKITGISIYESQVERLFDGTRQMGDAVRSYGAALGVLGDVAGPAERYWRTSRV
jgi:LmbE family N-acetylglucosaminyl deacetylase